MEFRSSSVMAYIVLYCYQHGIDINQTKIQKLLYCCYGVVLAVLGERLTDERPQAWMYGPVFPRTYKDVKKNKLTREMAREFESECPGEVLSLIHRTLDYFGAKSAKDLSNWSHEKGSPWSKTGPLMALCDSDVAEYFQSSVVSAVVNGGSLNGAAS